MKTNHMIQRGLLGLVLILGLGQTTWADWTLDGTTLSDGNWTLTVTVSGGNYTVSGYAAGSGELDLRNTGLNITTIAASVFKDKSAITGVVLPDTVTLIKDSAFRNMSALTNIVLSANLVSLENCAFFGDTKLVSVTPLLPAGANVSESAVDRAATGVDYRFVMAELGPCTRSRKP